MNEDTRIAYKDADGNVSVVMPTPEFINSGGTMAQFLEHSVPDGAIYEELHKDNIPTDRYFRNAWKLEGKKVDIDRPKAEKIHMDKLRKIRDEKLKAEDIEYQKALEYRDDAKMNAVANRKKKLRDMPTNTDLSGLTLDELKSFIPDVLKEGV